VDLYWIPLGAGGHSVRANGRVFEAIEAARQHRQRCDLYHAALVVGLDFDRHTIEVAPSPDADEASRGAAWLIATAGLHTDQLRPPSRGRAPGWLAGLEVARRNSAYDRGHAEAWEATAGRAGV
jgi:hypothetical protein